MAQKTIPITSWKENDFTPEIPIKIARTKLTKTAAEFDSNLSYERWLEIGVELAAMTDSCQWWIGDWLLHGKAKFGDEKYARAAALSGYENVALANFAWVSEAVKNSTRVESLSWSHHRLVAPLEDSEQVELLKLAQLNQWSVLELRNRIQEKTPAKEKQWQISKWFSNAFDKIKSLSLTPERKRELKDALKPWVELYETL